MGIELIEISDDSCKLKVEQNILKETNKQNIESEASTSSLKSPCRMSNTSFVDQDQGLHCRIENVPIFTQAEKGL